MSSIHYAVPPKGTRACAWAPGCPRGSLKASGAPLISIFTCQDLHLTGACLDPPCAQGKPLGTAETPHSRWKQHLFRAFICSAPLSETSLQLFFID